MEIHAFQRVFGALSLQNYAREMCKLFTYADFSIGDLTKSAGIHSEDAQRGSVRRRYLGRPAGPQAVGDG